MATARKWFYAPSCMLLRQLINGSTGAAAHPPLILPGPRDHRNSLCLSLIEQLISRGRLSSANRFTRQLLSNSASLAEAVSVVDYVASRGFPLHMLMDHCAALINKSVNCGQPRFAEAIFLNYVTTPSASSPPALSILNSMVVCFCQLGKLEAARAVFDTILALNSVPIPPAYGAFIRELCYRGMPLEAFHCFNTIAAFGIRNRIDPLSYNLLMNELYSRCFFSHAVQVFQIIRGFGFRPTLHQYKSVFYALCKTNQFIDAESISLEMESEGFFIDRTMYTCLIHGYIKADKIKMATTVFYRMLKMGCEPDAYTYNTLIDGFWKLGLFDQGWAFYSQMDKSNFVPNAVTHNVIIRRFCQKGEVDAALAWINKSVASASTLTVQSYTSLMIALYDNERPSEADELLANMLAVGILPDDVLFFVIARTYPKGKVVQLALFMLQALCKFDPRLGHDMVSLLRDIVTKDLELASIAFGICIIAHCITGEMDTALFFWEEMIEVGAKPLLFTCNSLLKGLCQNALFQNVELLIGSMQDKGVLPDLETYLILISELCNQGKFDSAFSLLGQMSERGLKPNVAIYDALIRCLGKNGMVVQANNLFESMLKGGIVPDEMVFTTMITAYEMNGRFKKANELFKKRVEYSIRPSLYFYTTLVTGLVEKNMFDRGCHHLKQMIVEGLEPNKVFYTCLINYFFKVGEFKFALRIVDLMGRKHVEHDLITYIVYFSGICRHITGVTKSWDFVNGKYVTEMERFSYLLQPRSRDPKANCLKIPGDSPTEMETFVLKQLEKVEIYNELMPNLYLYNVLISGYCRANKMEEAYRQVDLMRAEGISPNQVTCTLLINGHICSGDINSAMSIFNWMNAEGCTPDTITYDTVIKGLCKSKRLEEALCLSLALQKKGLFPSKSSYESLLGNLCASDAFRVFEEMRFMPNRKLRSRLVNKLCRYGRMSQAQIVYDFFKKKGKSVDKKVDKYMAESGFGSVASILESLEELCVLRKSPGEDENKVPAVIEFGAGRGYLTKLLADCYGIKRVFLVERKSYKLKSSRKFWCFFIFPCFLLETAYKVWWYVTGGTAIPHYGNIFVSDTMACVMELLSWLYRASIYFLVCVLYRLSCYLQILRIEDFAHVFLKETDVGSILKEHLRVRRCLCIISHRFRIFILLTLFLVTATSFISLLLLTRSSAHTNILKAGDLSLCAISLVSGLFICPRSAAKATHKAQSLTGLASKWHVCATIDSFDEGDGETPRARISDSQVLPVVEVWETDDEGEEDDELENVKLNPFVAQTISFQKRQALVTYLESNRAGITMFGFTLDRAWLHTIFAVQLALLLWLLNKTIGIS